MDSESGNENEDENNHSYTTYLAGESLRNPSPQHIPQPSNHTVSAAVIIGIQKNDRTISYERRVVVDYKLVLRLFR
ncbi:unnamed protein product [Brassica oleracea]